MNKEDNLAISKQTRERVRRRDKDICQICGVQCDDQLPENNPRFLTLDHIVPKALGGTNRVNNLQVTCYSCNQAKADGPPVDWPSDTIGGRLTPGGLKRLLDKVGRPPTKESA